MNLEELQPPDEEGSHCILSACSAVQKCSQQVQKTSLMFFLQTPCTNFPAVHFATSWESHQKEKINGPCSPALNAAGFILV